MKASEKAQIHIAYQTLERMCERNAETDRLLTEAMEVCLRQEKQHRKDSACKWLCSAQTACQALLLRHFARQRAGGTDGGTWWDTVTCRRDVAIMRALAQQVTDWSAPAWIADFDYTSIVDRS